MLPHPLPLLEPRHLRRLRENRRHHRANDLRTPPHTCPAQRPESGRFSSLAKPHYGDLRTVYAVRDFHYASDPGDEEEDA